MAAADPAVADKLVAPLGATTVLGELLARVPAGVPVVVVGPARALVPRTPPVLIAREEPAGGGPAAAVAAGVAALVGARILAVDPDDPGVPECAAAPSAPGGADVVVVLAGDAPWAPLAVPVLVAALRDAPPGVPAVVAVDASGARQPLLAVHRAGALVGRLDGAGDVAGRAAGWLLGSGALEVLVAAGAVDDVDTPEQLARARERAAGA